MEHRDPSHLLTSIAKILNRLEIPYLVSGGMAVLIWGRPRFTADIDIVVELSRKQISPLTNSLAKLDGYIDVDAALDALNHQGEFNYIDMETGVKVDFWILKKNDPFDKSRLTRKVQKKIFNETIYFTSPEDLILIKLKWYKASESSRQMEDVESIFKISGHLLDTNYLKVWAEKLGVEDILDKVSKN